MGRWVGWVRWDQQLTNSPFPGLTQKKQLPRQTNHKLSYIFCEALWEVIDRQAVYELLHYYLFSLAPHGMLREFKRKRNSYKHPFDWNLVAALPGRWSFPFPNSGACFSKLTVRIFFNRESVLLIWRLTVVGLCSFLLRFSPSPQFSAKKPIMFRTCGKIYGNACYAV